MQSIEHRLVVDAQLRGDAGGTLATGAGHEDLAATQEKGVCRAQAFLLRRPLLLGQRANKHGRSPADQGPAFSFTYLGQALGPQRRVIVSRPVRALTLSDISPLETRRLSLSRNPHFI